MPRLWGRRDTTRSDDPGVLERIASLERQTHDLTTAGERFERGLRSLQLEWEDSYDKLRRLMARLNARDRRDAGDDPPESVTAAERERAEASPFTGTHARLQAMRRRFR